MPVFPGCTTRIFYAHLGLSCASFVILMGLEPILFRLKVGSFIQLSYRINCLSGRVRTCGLTVPNRPLYQTELHLVSGGSLRCRSPYLSVLTVFKTGLQAAAIKLPLIPREESNLQTPQSKCGDFANSSTGEFKANMSKNFCSGALCRNRTHLS